MAFHRFSKRPIREFLYLVPQGRLARFAVWKRLDRAIGVPMRGLFPVRIRGELAYWHDRSPVCFANLFAWP